MYKQKGITLIARADDCGSSLGANEGCYEAATHGFIKNISLMAVGPAIEDAARQMAHRRDICFGLHFTMNAEWEGVTWKPLSDPEKIPSLINAQGNFYPDTTFDGTTPVIAEIKIEWYAQLQRLRDLGFTICYADTHMFPELKIAGLQDAMSAWIADEHLIDARYFYEPLPLMDDVAHVEGLFEKIMPHLVKQQYYYLCHPVKKTADMLNCYNARNPKGKVRDKRNQERQFVISLKTAQTLRGNHITAIRYDQAVQREENRNSLTTWRHHESTRGYTVNSIDVDTFRIDDIFKNHMYLVEGSEQAALIDSGMGVPGLAKFVYDLCRKPIILLHTHGHFDHIGASSEFTNAFLHEADMPIFQEHASAAYRDNILPHFIAKTSFKFREEELAFLYKGHPTPLRPFSKTGKINLGNRTLQILATPGHTPGSVCFLDAEKNYLFSGDTVVDKGIMLSFPESKTPTEMKQSLLYLYEHVNKDVSIYGGHHQVPMHSDILQAYITLLESIEKDALCGYKEKGTFQEQMIYQSAHLCIACKP